MHAFNVNNLNQTSWYHRAYTESVAIHSKDSTRRGRTLDQVIEDSFYGLAAETFLIEQCGFTDDPRPYRDLLSPNGTPVEIKVTRYDHYVNHQLGRAREKRLQNNTNHPDYVIVFVNDTTKAIYNFAGVWTWCNDSKVWLPRTRLEKVYEELGYVYNPTLARLSAYVT